MPACSIVAGATPAAAVQDGPDEGVERWRLEREHEAWIGAELADPERHRVDERPRDRFGALRHRARQQNHRVDAAHLGVDRNRLGPRGTGVVQRADRARSDPVNATALVAGCFTSASPTSCVPP